MVAIASTENKQVLGPWLLAVLDAQEATARVVTDELPGVAAAVATYAARVGCTHLAASSTIAERIVGAALILDARLAGLAPSQPAQTLNVLVIDAVVAGTTGLESTAQRLLAAGAARVQTVVVDVRGPSKIAAPRLAEVAG